ncbi:MAG: glycosyltransferase family 9 protein [Rhodocyclales bacterium]|nr:glycosyltransferase family 9 protein [Rhodocyclales bacterium]
MPETIADSAARKQVLIIKTGYSETLDQYTTGAVSLGDVLRTTVILHLFPPETHAVTWLTDLKSLPLLKDNPYIERLLTVNPFTPYQLTAEWFDIVVNFEKEPGICVVADRIPAWRHYGFRFDPSTRIAQAYDHADEAITMSKDPDFKRQQTKSWAVMLWGMLGQRYNGEGYILGYQPKSLVTHDVGLNHLVGVRYPLKRWPEERWNALQASLAQAGYSVSWQQGEHDIESYIEWINTCRVVVTNDSLGLHIAMALGKKVIALFGPTLASEIDATKDVVKLLPEKPCVCDFAAARCVRDEACIATITPQVVVDTVSKLLSGNPS